MTTKNSKSVAFPTEPTPIKQLATVLTRLSLSDLDSLVKSRKIKAPRHSARDLIDPNAVLATYAAARSEVEFDDDDDDDEAEGEFLSDFTDFINDPLIAAMLQASPEGIAELFLDVYDSDDEAEEEEEKEAEEEAEEEGNYDDDDDDDWEEN